MGKVFAFLLVVFCWVIIPLVSGYGWVMNIVKLLHTHGDLGVLFIARCLGVIAAPLGIVLGFI